MSINADCVPNIHCISCSHLESPYLYCGVIAQRFENQNTPAFCRIDLEKMEVTDLYYTECLFYQSSMIMNIHVHKGMVYLAHMDGELSWINLLSKDETVIPTMQSF